MQGNQEEITLTHKDRHVFITRKLNGLSQVSTACEAILSEAVATSCMSDVQYWHEALGHSLPQTCNARLQRYQDGQLIPKRPPVF